MNFYIIHNSQFPTRKEFIDAQFRRYGISEYEFVDIESDTKIVSAYIEAFERISSSETVNCGVILIDTIMLTRNFLEYVYFAHLQMISTEFAHDIIFITKQTDNVTTPKKLVTKFAHTSSWNIDDEDIIYSNLFMISKQGASHTVRFNNTCLRRNEYKSVDTCFLRRNPETKTLVQTIKSVDLLLYNVSKTYADSFVVSWLQ